MTVTITAENEAKIRQKVESGRYHSADEVIAEALRLLDEHERLQWLRVAIAEGMEGEAVELTAEMKAASWERAKRRAAAGNRPDPAVMVSDDTR